jgi:hypothetical protein
MLQIIVINQVILKYKIALDKIWSRTKELSLEALL